MNDKMNGDTTPTDTKRDLLPLFNIRIRYSIRNIKSIGIRKEKNNINFFNWIKNNIPTYYS